MIRLALLFSIIAGPAFADMRMTNTQCEKSWLRLISLIYPPQSDDDAQDDPPDHVRALQEVNVATPDGWCVIQPNKEPALPDDVIREVSWRADDIDAFITRDGLPERLALRLSGVQLDDRFGPDYLIDVMLRHDPDQGLVFVDHLALTHAEEPQIAVSAIIGGAFFRDVGSAITSIGGVHLLKLDGTVDLSPALVADVFPDLTGRLLQQIGSELSFAQLDRTSKAEVFALARELPEAEGQSRLDFRSERGLGLLQLGLAQTKNGAEAVAIALSGSSVTFDWDAK